MSPALPGRFFKHETNSKYSYMDVRVGWWRKLSTEELMHLNCGVGEGSWESLGLQGDPTSSSSRRSVLGVHWKDWCWSWNSSTLATWCEELTHWKRPWCWERLKAWGEGEDRGWDGWMASLTRWTWVWVNSRSWWWTGRPGVLRFMGSQRVGHDWATELNWIQTLSAWFEHSIQFIYGLKNWQNQPLPRVYDIFIITFSSISVSVSITYAKTWRVIICLSDYLLSS